MLTTLPTPRNLDLTGALSHITNAARRASDGVERGAASIGIAASTAVHRAAASVEGVVSRRIKARVGPPITAALALSSVALVVAVVALYRATSRRAR